MTLTDPADGWIALHLANVVEIEGHHQRTATHSSCSETGLNTRVTSTHNNYIEYRI